MLFEEHSLLAKGVLVEIGASQLGNCLPKTWRDFPISTG